MIRRLTALAVLAVALPAAAQDARKPDPPRPPAGKTERVVHPVRGGDPAALVELLGLHAPDVRASAAGGVVVVSGPADAVADAGRLLAEVDRPRRMVVVEVTLVDVAPKKADDPKDGPEPKLDDADVVARLDELAKAGRAAVQRIRVTAVEGQPAAAQTGGDKPVVTASAGFPGGGGRGGFPGGGAPVQRSVSYRPLGATVKVTAWAGADGSAAVDLSVQDTSLKPGEGDDAPSFESGTLTTKLTVPAGRAVVAQAVRRDGKAGRAVTLVIVTAKVLDPGGVAAR